ncbi:hypothetical protein JTB14_024695 [Gonioctena quinquepunctata]|nr:hypothetical protein JTB14_024695 [Gonioctena quinquepunctata]
MSGEPGGGDEPPPKKMFKEKEDVDEDFSDFSGDSNDAEDSKVAEFTHSTRKYLTTVNSLEAIQPIDQTHVKLRPISMIQIIFYQMYPSILLKILLNQVQVAYNNMFHQCRSGSSRKLHPENGINDNRKRYSAVLTDSPEKRELEELKYETCQNCKKARR